MNKTLQMTGFEPRTSGVGSDRFTNWAKPLPNFYFFPKEKGRNPGPVVMGGGSRSEGCGFESQRYILDGHFSLLFVVKLYWCLFEKTENK